MTAGQFYFKWHNEFRIEHLERGSRGGVEECNLDFKDLVLNSWYVLPRTHRMTLKTYLALLNLHSLIHEI